jgi:hypothetical protein
VRSGRATSSAPRRSPTPTTTRPWASPGGPALFLLAQIIFTREAAGQVPRSRPLALAALAILAVVTSPLTLIVGIAASAPRASG